MPTARRAKRQQRLRRQRSTPAARHRSLAELGARIYLTSGHVRQSDYGYYGDPVQPDPTAHPKRPLAGGPGAPRTGELRLQSAPASLDPEQPPPLSWPAHPASVEPMSDLLPRGRADPRP